jgi:hypothetical protein
VPEIFRHHGYRFFFFSREAEEPIHVHIESAEKYAKFWLDPILLAESHGYLSRQLREIRELIQENEDKIRREWDEHVTKAARKNNCRIFCEPMAGLER